MTLEQFQSIVPMGQHSIVVVFGRPGSGKTSVSEKAAALHKQTVSIKPHTSGGVAASNSGGGITCLDLDVCVPQWMKDKFARGVYPTPEQRKEFAIDACDYVNKQLDAINLRCDEKVIISFSFVNTDLRNIFRNHFPTATWVLINTSEATAQDRINRREGHFYKGIRNVESSEVEKGSVKRTSKTTADNSDWHFAPVDFDHIILDGLQSIEENARKVILVLNSERR
ncbi:hypothetical protein SARC_00164 [Sphaeroforma arctica JP610]|uniref:Uncharacterized protein n=1 Tax=Sphaeroforma arctica JP610 TaxID=667725 RepID=A0A0L0GFA2_9EUKA|nr:hypothetical protein SARC_00164 [Sphaeroforma arctica JP610]KNC87730.1 hypothetical protein SARC_00164 [Sphaeroforma arctica JP610]|eukprot:XP_014161632.1 hypothetical protein SARC_00164 [Sphaeroforma arctica JP610]